MVPVVWLVVTGLMLIGTPLYAQDPTPTPQPGRVYRGLFGGARANQASRQGLQLDVRFGAGYDNNVITAEPSTLAPTTTTVATVPRGRKGSFEQGSVGLTYSLAFSRISFSARAGSNASHYPGRRNPYVRSHGGNLSVSAPLWSGARLSATENISYRPFYYLPGLAAGAISEASLEEVIDLDETTGGVFGNHTNTSSGASFSQLLSTRVSLSLNYHYDRSHSTAGTRDFLNRSGAGGFTVALAKGLGLRLGYGFTDSRFGASGTQQTGYKTHNYDFGLNFSRALSLTRTTTISFSTGSVAVQSQNRTYYRLTGNAALNRQLGRSWSTQLAYDRGISFDETFGQPLAMDAVGLSLNGLITRRLDFQADAGASRGRLGFTSASNGLETFYGRSSLNVALHRSLALGLDYSFFKHAFDRESAALSGFITRADRHRVRIYLSLWMPLLSKQNRGTS